MSKVDECVNIINDITSKFTPRVGVVLGSGLGSFADKVKEKTVISFNELPGFPTAGVGGHKGKLILGFIGNTKIAILQGRSHYYENGKSDTMAIAIRTLKGIGCEGLVLTNAAGSMITEAPLGSIMLITDHINMTGVSPLFGVQGNDRFVDMSEAYSNKLNSIMRDASEINNINFFEGIYAWMCGPQFETPAEIRALKVLGADAVGMSTVPEVIIARHAEIPLCAISVLTNYAAGMSDTALSHEQTVVFAKKAENSVNNLLTSFLNYFDNS